jgi:hypothetical protein
MARVRWVTLVVDTVAGKEKPQPIALLIAFGPPYHRRPTGSAPEIRSMPR